MSFYKCLEKRTYKLSACWEYVLYAVAFAVEDEFHVTEMFAYIHTGEIELIPLVGGCP